MALSHEKVSQVIEKHHLHSTDTGSVEVQVALLTERINGLSDHFKINKKDHASRRGLLQLVSRRRSLLEYVKRRNEQRYASIIGTLGIRR